jgi:biopolymer transport protein ExbD
MKFGSKGPARYESGPNLTPLVDVVMVILIFLMLVGQFIGNEKYLQQRSGLLDQAASVAQANPSDPLDQTITINVRRTGDRFVAVIDGKGVADADGVAALLSQKRSALQSAGLMPATDDPADTEGKRERVTIAISPERTVLHRDYMSVYDAALRAGFKKVTFTIQR